MKKLIVGLLMFVPFQIVNGQDRIITVQKDTIHCRIVSISPNHIQYEQMEENGIPVGKFIPTEQVSEYFRSPQSAETDLHDQTYPQETQLVKKHYLGFSFAPGLGIKNGDDYIGVGFEYAHRNGNGELGIEINCSNLYIFLPITTKKHLGKYFFIGFGFIPGYDWGESLYIGVSAMLGVEYVSKNGVSFSLTPSFRQSIINVTRSTKTEFTNYGGSYKYITLLEMQQHVIISIGIGYRF